MKNTRCSGSSKGKVKVELKKTEARICEKKKKVWKENLHGRVESGIGGE
jgi:hypothetical protein